MIELRTFLRNCLIAPIRFYQRGISPMFPPCCRFTPTCSQYAIESIEKYGIFRGTTKAIFRILRCHPWHPGGYDRP